MFLVGLTGGIATGKSTVSKFIKDLGIPIIDADAMARRVVEPGKPAWRRIKEEFGDCILLEDGNINRAMLGDIIFSDPAKRRLLNKITHPYIHKAMIWEAAKCFIRGYKFAVLDLPLLFESGILLDYLHKIIVVYCDRQQQVQRLMSRNSFTEEEAEMRIRAQMPLEEKCQKANFVIDNSGSLEETQTHTQGVCSILKGSWVHWRLRLMLMAWLVAVCGLSFWLYKDISSRNIKQDSL